jgi:hypothetical protein
MTTPSSELTGVGAAAIPGHWHQETSWADLPLAEHPGGILTRHFAIGHPDEPDGPFVVWVQFPANFAVAPHTHRCDYTEIILDGTQRVGRTWHEAGAIRIVKAGTVYGPLVAGPSGVTALVIFQSRRAIEPEWVHPETPTSTANGYVPSGA